MEVAHLPCQDILRCKSRPVSYTHLIQSDRVTFLEMSIEDYDYPPDSFDVVLSSLVFHYIENWDALLFKIVRTLKPGGDLIFSCEHPIFTAYGNQDWLYQADGSILCWPVDRYFESGARDAIFLGETIVKYHRTLTDYLRPLFASGLVLTNLIEPTPAPDRLEEPGMRDELRRPMMLLLSAHKPLDSSQEG